MIDRKSTAALAILASFATPALGQSNEWSYEATGYLFAASTDVSIGNVEGTLSFSDALDNLDFAGMAAFVATNNEWTLIGDFMFFDLAFRNTLPTPGAGTVSTDQKNTILSGYALYRAYEAPGVLLDLGAGFRYFTTRTRVTVQPGVGPTVQRSTDDDWIDPLIAAHARFDISDRWDAMVGADYGGFFDDRETYSATVTFDYSFTESWVGRLGYRYIRVEDAGRDRTFRFEQSGPIVGVSYRF